MSKGIVGQEMRGIRKYFGAVPEGSGAWEALEHGPRSKHEERVRFSPTGRHGGSAALQVVELALGRFW